MNGTHTLGVLIIIYTIYWLVYLTEDIFYRKRVEDLIEYSTNSRYYLEYNGFSYYFFDEELEEARNLAIEVSEMSPYEFGYYSYWEGLEFSEINNDQKNGYLDAKYEVEVYSH